MKTIYQIRQLLLFVIFFGSAFATHVAAQNKALDFDGINDYVKVSTPLGTNLNTFTIETWFYARGTFNYNALLNGDGWGTSSTHFQIAADGKLQLAINGIAPQWPQSTTVLQSKRWYHVAVTYDKTANEVKFYIDGKLDNTISLTTSVAVNLTASCIGAWENGVNPSRFFNGRLDEMRIWNTVRTLPEIKENMFKQLGGNESGLVAHYNFNQTTGTTLTDLTNGSHNGTLTNFALTGTTSNWVNSGAMAPVLKSIQNISTLGFTINWEALKDATKYRLDVSTTPDFGTLLVNNRDAGSGTSFTLPLTLTIGTTYYCRLRAEIGVSVTTFSSEPLSCSLPTPMVAPGNALDFDGVNDYVKITNPLGNDLSNFTIETWLCARGAFNYNALLNGNAWSTGSTHFQIAADGKLQLAIDGIAPQWPQSTTTLQSNRWYHVAVTYDKTAKQVNFYINGVLDNTVSLATASNVNLTASCIGAWDNGSNLSRFFNGQLDEMRIWNTTRTLPEITQNIFKQLNGNESGLVAYYNFNHGDFANLMDIATAGGNQDGVLTNFSLSGATSNWINSTTMAPFVKAATQITPIGFTANWTPVAGASNYRIDVAISPDFAMKVADNVDAGNGSSFTLSLNLNPKTVYYYRIRAEIGSWTSPSSKALSLKVPSAAPGNALAFDGVNDYVQMPCPTLTNFTLEFWINTTQTAPSYDFWDTSVGLIDAHSASFHALTQRDFGVVLSNGGRIAFLFRNANSTTFIPTTNEYNDGKWHHIAITRENGNLKIYTDGVLDRTSSFNAEPLSNIQSLRLGQVQNSFSTAPYFKGKMDEVRLWNRALTLSELQAGMYTELEPMDNGLIAYYKLNEAEENTILNNAFGSTDVGVLNNFNASATSGWVESYAMGIPLPLTPTEVTSDGFTLNWEVPTVVGTVDKYVVELALNKDFNPFQAIDCGTALSKAITGLMPNTNYFYRVQAKRAVVTGAGAYSPARSVNTLTAGINNVKGNGINIYPNPVTSGFFVEADEKSSMLNVYNLAGSLVYTVSVKGKTYVDISSLPKGVYTVKIDEKATKLLKVK